METNQEDNWERKRKSLEDLGSETNQGNEPNNKSVIDPLIKSLIKGAIIVGGVYLLTKTYTFNTHDIDGYKIEQMRIFPSKFVTYEHNEFKNLDDYHSFGLGIKKNSYIDEGCDGKVDKLYSELDNRYERGEDPRTEGMFLEADEELAKVKKELGIETIKVESE